MTLSGQRLLHAFQQEGGFDFVNRRESPALTRLRREATGWMGNLEKALFHLPKGKMLGALSCYPFIFQATKGMAMDGSTLMHHYLRIFDSMMRGDSTVSEPELYSALRQTESLNLRLRYPARLETWLESTKQRWTTLYRNILSSQEEPSIKAASIKSEKRYTLAERIGIAAILIKEDLNPTLPKDIEEEQFKERIARIYLPLLEKPEQLIGGISRQSVKSGQQLAELIGALIRFNQSLCNTLLTFTETMQNERRLRSLLPL